MPNKYIYKGGDLDPTQGVARAAVAHFTKYGVFKVGQDGSTYQGLSFDDVAVVTTNTTLTPQQSGRVVFCNAAAGVTITLPKASYGKMRFRIADYTDVTSNQTRVTPNSADYIKGFRLAPAQGVGVDIDSGSDAAGDYIDLLSNGIDTWYIVGSRGTITASA